MTTTITPTTATTTIRAALCTLLLLLAAPSRADDRVALDLDLGRSHVVAVTGKSGIFGFLGHEHAILATRWRARFGLDRLNPSRSTAEVTVPVASLEIDSVEGRRAAGLTSSSPDVKDLPKIQATMLGPEVLDSAKHPTLSFKATAIDGKEKGKLELKGDLTLHGVTREVSFPVTMEPGPDETLKLAGTLTTRLKDHGIDPPSTAGVGVKNEIEIRFLFQTRPKTAVARR